MNQMYEIEKTPGTGWVLWIDNEQSACPYLPPMFAQTKMGGQQIMRVPCSTTCPMAEIRKTTISADDKTTERLEYIVHCGCASRFITVTVKGEQKQPSILKSL